MLLSNEKLKEVENSAFCEKEIIWRFIADRGASAPFMPSLTTCSIAKYGVHTQVQRTDIY